MFDLTAIQSALRNSRLDGWLLYDFRASNILARRILQFSDGTVGSRRWAYFIPSNGAPRKLVHRIESGSLDHLPGEKQVYLKWQEFEAGIASLVSGRARVEEPRTLALSPDDRGEGKTRVAMEYSPRNGNPYISRVDAGTVELVRAAGADIVPSGDLIQLFEAVWDDEQWAMHIEAGRHTDSAYVAAWSFIANEVRSKGETTEAAVCDVIMDHFAKHGLTTYHPPIVGVNAHSGDPHYETGTAPIRKDDFVLVDLWAKLDKPRAVYSDLTRVGFVGENVPPRYDEIFQIVAAARDAAIQLVKDRFARKQALQGFEVDDAARGVIDRAGYGQYFVHRTGHSIGQETHGNGANIDNLETHETRQILPGCCFSIEPGIYLSDFGVRSEVDVFVDKNSQVHVTAGDLQTSVIPILRAF